MIECNMLIAQSTTNSLMAMLPQFGLLAVFIGLMYFMLIRPQRKKEKEVSEMRASLRTGDEIVTIGGIVGKVVKIGEEELVIQVGSDKTKIKVKKWSISSIERKAGAKAVKKEKAEAAAVEEEEKPAKKKKTPKRLKKDKEEKEEKPAKAEEEASEE